MHIFIDAVVDELGCDVDIRFRIVKLTFMSCGVEAIYQNLLIYVYELFFIVVGTTLPYYLLLQPFSVGLIFLRLCKNICSDFRC